jgi:hypothetical protein
LSHATTLEGPWLDPPPTLAHVAPFEGPWLHPPYALAHVTPFEGPWTLVVALASLQRLHQQGIIAFCSIFSSYIVSTLIILVLISTNM